MNSHWYQVNHVTDGQGIEYFKTKGITRFGMSLDPRHPHFTPLKILRDFIESYPDLKFGIVIHESSLNTVKALKDLFRGLPLFWEAHDLVSSELLAAVQINHDYHLREITQLPLSSYISSLSVEKKTNTSLKQPWSLMIKDLNCLEPKNIHQENFLGYKLVLDEKFDSTFRKSDWKIVDKIWEFYA
jgi:hypothetical protein